MKYMKYTLMVLLGTIFFGTTAFCQEDVITAYFEDNPCTLYYFGTRYYYQGIVFNEVFKDGDFEDRYTQILYLVPVTGGTGICIQVDEDLVLDAFTFIFDQSLDKFIQAEKIPDILFLVHRSNLLEEMLKARFRLQSLMIIKDTLDLYSY